VKSEINQQRRAQTHSDGAFLPFVGRFFLLSVRKPLKASVVSMEKIVPDFLAQEMLFQFSVRLLAGIDKGARLDWSGASYARNRGFLRTGGNPIELLLLSPAN
jgi:hypothetical protein